VTNKEFAKKLEERTRKFAVRVIEISKKLPSSPEGLIIKDQFTKAGTSVGANYREANRARSPRDFKSVKPNVPRRNIGLKPSVTPTCLNGRKSLPIMRNVASFWLFSPLPTIKLADGLCLTKTLAHFSTL
jgi:hypothetical protein